jgi:hypothetical protein
MGDIFKEDDDSDSVAAWYKKHVGDTLPDGTDEETYFDKFKSTENGKKWVLKQPARACALFSILNLVWHTSLKEQKQVEPLVDFLKAFVPGETRKDLDPGANELWSAYASKLDVAVLPRDLWENAYGMELFESVREHYHLKMKVEWLVKPSKNITRHITRLFAKEVRPTIGTLIDLHGDAMRNSNGGLLLHEIEDGLSHFVAYKVDRTDIFVLDPWLKASTSPIPWDEYASQHAKCRVTRLLKIYDLYTTTANDGLHGDI